MKYFELDKKEREILEDFENKSFVRVPAFREKRKKYQSYARMTFAKTRNINIRVTEKDLQEIKAKAAQKGIPYQTLLASIIHQYSSGQMSDRVISSTSSKTQSQA